MLTYARIASTRRILAAALALCVLRVHADTPANSSTDPFLTAPKVPQTGDCVGYPDESAHMPASFKQQLDSLNLRFRKAGDAAEERFKQATGRVGQEWEAETSASTTRYVQAMHLLKSPDLPPRGPDGYTSTPEQMHKFEVESAQWKLEIVRLENRHSEEEAVAALRFVQRGGDPNEKNILENSSKDLFEECRRNGDKIYAAYWAWDKQKKAQP